MRGVKFEDVKSTFIWENVSIHGIYPENIKLGRRYIITSGTKIFTHFLDSDRLSEIPDHYFRFYKGQVIIKEDCFVGLNVVIASPLTIGKGSLIRANSVLMKDVAPGSVMVGASA